MKTRPWIVASAFVWTLAGAVALAAYSGEAPALVNLTGQNGAAPATVGALAPASGTTAVVPAEVVPAEIQWEESFENAMQRARAEDKPILIDFYTDWCGPCKDMEARTYPDRNVIAQSQNWVTVKVNGDKRPDVMQAYGISGFPTLMFAQSNGKPVASTTGYMDAPQLVQTMQTAYSKWTGAKDKA